MNKIVVVTGAGRGLGYCIAARHLEMKDKVYAYERHITDELKDLGKDCDLLKIQQCDIASTESVTNAMREVVTNEKQVDILYNVAAIYRFEDRVGLAETDLDLCAHMYDINAVGALRVCKAILPLLKSGTVIINISSEAGSIGNCWREREYAYCMSKAALNMGAKILSNELSKQSVRILNIHPGWMRTVMGGPRAMASSNSIPPDESAKNIVDIALNINSIPKEQMFIQHTREPLPW